MVAALQEVDTILADSVNEPMFPGDPTGPGVRFKVSERLRFSEPLERVL